jgi:hypothetical protein
MPAFVRPNPLDSTCILQFLDMRFNIPFRDTYNLSHLGHADLRPSFPEFSFVF